MSVQSNVKKALDALVADIAALQSQCASLASQVGSLSSGIDSSGTRWIRFSDGTQVCYGTFSDDRTTNFPKAFNAHPSVTVSAVGYNSDNYNGIGGVASLNDKYVSAEYFRGGLTNTYLTSFRSSSGNYIAVGRWK